MKLWAVILVVVVCSVLPVSGDIYTWVDRNGVKHFSSEPPPGAKKVERQTEIRHSSDQYDQWEEQRKSNQTRILEESRSNEAQSEKETDVSRRMRKRPGDVVMYATPTCGYCARARAFFKKHNISYTEYDITKDKQAHQRYKKLNGSGVPLIFVGNNRVPGFNEPLLQRLLNIN